MGIHKIKNRQSLRYDCINEFFYKYSIQYYRLIFTNKTKCRVLFHKPDEFRVSNGCVVDYCIASCS